MSVALLQLSDTTRAWLNQVNVAALIPAFAESSLAAFVLFLLLSLVLYLVANEYLLKGEDEPPAPGKGPHAQGPAGTAPVHGEA